MQDLGKKTNSHHWRLGLAQSPHSSWNSRCCGSGKRTRLSSEKQPMLRLYRKQEPIWANHTVSNSSGLAQVGVGRELQIQQVQSQWRCWKKGRSEGVSHKPTDGWRRTGGHYGSDCASPATIGQQESLANVWIAGGTHELLAQYYFFGFPQISSEMGNLKIIIENEVQGTLTVRRKLGVLPDKYQLRNGTYAGWDHSSNPWVWEPLT